MRDLARALKAAVAVDDLDETRWNPSDRPPCFLGLRFGLARLPDLPAGRRGRPGRLDHLCIDLGADRHVTEQELLEHAAVLVDHARFQDEARCDVGPEFVAVAKTVLRLEHPRLRI